MPHIAVIDVETTGLNPYRHDRVIEIAAVVLSREGAIIREFVSLVNPRRDVGPTSIHGLSAEDFLLAPSFDEIVGGMIDACQNCVGIAGHNIRFDHSFLSSEFTRAGLSLPDFPAVCTMRLAGGGSLVSCCEAFEVPFERGVHSALDDARATALLLIALLKDDPQRASEIFERNLISWPQGLSSAQPLNRMAARQRQLEPPTYLARLLSRAMDNYSETMAEDAALSYMALLDRVLEDRLIDDQEGNDLYDVATHWGLGPAHIQVIHAEYVFRLAVAALDDAVVTEAEHKDIRRVAHQLGLSLSQLEEIWVRASKLPPRQAIECGQVGVIFESGQSVCFTGECQCSVEGQIIDRSQAAAYATAHGLQVLETVTKKLDFLIVSDPMSQSGKAKKARKYGIRILHEPVFWKALKVEVD